MKPIFTIIVIVILFCSFQFGDQKRETILDNISHIEDSIHYQIDTIPCLCNLLSVPKQIVDIGNCNIYCEVEGEGIPIVLINGGPGGTHHYFHPWFTNASKFCKVIYYDQRGCGQSDFNKGNGYTFKQAIDDLDKLRQELNIEKWIVCGYSYGGALAQYYTVNYPENVLGMVLIGSEILLQKRSLYGSREYEFISKDEEVRINEIYDLYQTGQITFSQLLYNKNINGDWKRQNFHKPTENEFIRSALYEWKNDIGFNQIMGNSYAQYDFKHIFDNCPIPTLLCEGKWDLSWKANKKNIIRKHHPNAKFVLFQKSGHRIFNDETELFFLTLEEFAKSLEPISNTEVEVWKNQSQILIEPEE